MSEADIAMLRRAWEAFTRGDIDAATEIMDPDVRWSGAGDPDAEGACHSRTDARAFIHRALADGVGTELLDIEDFDGRYVLTLHAQAPADRGEREPHGEIVTVCDGRVVEMVVYPTIEDALAAARCPAV